VFTRLVSLPVLVCLLTLCVLSPARATAKSTKLESVDTKRAAKVKAAIAHLGTGPDAQVTIDLRDKTKLVGYISSADERGFVVTATSGDATTVQYPDVSKVHGQNLRTRWKVVIGAAVAAGVIITLVLVRGAFCDGC